MYTDGRSQARGPGPQPLLYVSPPPPPSGFPGGLQGSKTAHDGFQTALEASRAP